MNSRIVIILHPNTSRVDFVLNDRMFNQERYSFSRKLEPVAAEAILLDVLNNCTIGINKAETSKNVLKLELEAGMYYSEWLPAVIIAIQQWAWAGDADYKPLIYCDDRVWDKEPVYNEEGYSTLVEGVKRKPGTCILGIEYIVWED